MPSTLRDGVRVALNRPRVLGIVILAVVLETSLRLALALAHPTLAVLCPPVIAVPLLGAAAPFVRAVARDADASPSWALTTHLSDRGPRLLGAAVLGHAAALAGGTALFLVLDTAVRLGWYALGGTLPLTVVLLAPLSGVALGTLLAWAVLVPGLADVSRGGTFRGGARTAVTTVLAAPRRPALVGVLVLGCALVVGGAVATGVAYAAPGRSPVTLLVAVGILAVLATVSVAPVAYATATALFDGTSVSVDVPVRRLALCALLVVGLVVGASALRVTDTRPMADERAPLPDEPTAAYATALSNTAESGYALTHRSLAPNGTVVLNATQTLDPAARQYRETIWTPQTGTGNAYATSGVLYAVGGVTARYQAFSLTTRHVHSTWFADAFPGYWLVTDDDRRRPITTWPGLPPASAGEWRVVSRSNGTLTVGLDEGPAAVRAVSGGGIPPENATYHAARVRMTIDTDRGVVTGGSARVNATQNGDPAYTARVTYDVRTRHVEATRPDVLGAPSAGEWVWGLFAY